MPFAERDSITLDGLQRAVEQEEFESLLLPVTAALHQFPEFALNQQDGDRIRQGKVVSLDSKLGPGLYRLILEDGRFIGLGEALPNGQMKAKRLMNTAG